MSDYQIYRSVVQYTWDTERKHLCDTYFIYKKVNGMYVPIMHTLCPKEAWRIINQSPGTSPLQDNVIAFDRVH